MRRNTFISVLILAAAGCSASSDDLGAKDYDEGSDAPVEQPAGSDQLVEEADPLRATDYGLVLFDTSSSMNTVRPSTGNTRCADAKTMAKSQIDSFFNPTRYNGSGIAVFAFDNSGSQSDDVQPTQTGYYTSAASAKTAVDNLTCGNGDDTTTPLADAFCKGLNGDGETFTLNGLDVVFIQTDGLENSSNGSNDPYDPYDCDGPSGPISTVGTWQYNVYQMMTTTGISVSTAYWINPALLYSEQSIDSFAVEEIDPVTEEIMIVADIEGLPSQKVDQLLFTMGTTQQQQQQPPPDGGLQQVCDTIVDCEIQMIQYLATDSGEEWTVIRDDNGAYPVEGDVYPAEGPYHPTSDPVAEEPLPAEY